jgi:iron complex outermembrane receptor protein
VNAGDTLRQGAELSATYETRKWNAYASYAFVDATLDTCIDPTGVCAFLEAGDSLPGIPRHRFKAGIEYSVTSKWKVGTDLVAASDSPFFPNENGSGDELASYARVDLNTSYDVTDNVQVYGLVKNLFDSRYGLYGTYFNAADVSGTDKELGGAGFTDNRTISPSMPFAAYGGVKVRY